MHLFYFLAVDVLTGKYEDKNKKKKRPQLSFASEFKCMLGTVVYIAIAVYVERLAGVGGTSSTAVGYTSSLLTFRLGASALLALYGYLVKVGQASDDDINKRVHPMSGNPIPALQKKCLKEEAEQGRLVGQAVIDYGLYYCPAALFISSLVQGAQFWLSSGSS